MTKDAEKENKLGKKIYFCPQQMNGYDTFIFLGCLRTYDCLDVETPKTHLLACNFMKH